MAAASDENRQNWRSQVQLLEQLPADFLQFHTDPEQAQIEADRQTAQAMMAHQTGFGVPSMSMPRLSITIIQAKLTKNYGYLRMDTYCRIRVGHSLFETPTAESGGKNPRWGKTVYCYLPQGVDSMYIEIFDQKMFTMDERVAWCHVPISEKVFNGDTVDDWFMLSGKEGENKEGMINLVLSYNKNAPAPTQHAVYPHPNAAPGTTMMFIPPAVPTVIYQQPVLPTVPPNASPGNQPPTQTPPEITEQDIEQIKDMFPDTDSEVIRSLLENNRGDKDATINNILEMNSS